MTTRRHGDKPTTDDRTHAACVAEDISALITRGCWGKAEGVIAEAILDERNRVLDRTIPITLAAGAKITITLREILAQQQSLGSRPPTGDE